MTVQIKTAPAVSEEQRKEKQQAKRKAAKAKKAAAAAQKEGGDAAAQGPEGSANMGTTLNDAEGVQEGAGAAKKAPKKRSKVGCT